MTYISRSIVDILEDTLISSSPPIYAWHISAYGVYIYITYIFIIIVGI